MNLGTPALILSATTVALLAAQLGNADAQQVLRAQKQAQQEQPWKLPLEQSVLPGVAGVTGAAATVAGESHDSYTSAIWHFNDDTQYTDSSDFGNDLTNSGLSLTATSPKFGDKCLDTGAGKATIAATLPTELLFRTGEWTIDFWIWFDSVGSNRGIFQYGSYVSGLYLRYTTSTNLNLYVNNTSYAWTVTAPTTNQWYHYEFTRDASNVIRFFQDGTVHATTHTNGGDLNPTGSLELGLVDAAAYHYGKFDEFRISNGIARHTSSFTPETSAYG